MQAAERAASDHPKVSVLLQTYNHRPYISQAVESALAQRVDFPYEAVLADDCSNDGTREIVVDFAQRFPNTIRPLLPDRTLGHDGNRLFSRAFETARGEYVALLDGDDYWTSPLKLQAQADLLDTGPRFIACYQNARIVDETGDFPRSLYCAPDQRRASGIHELLVGNFIPTCTAMIRKSALPPLPAWVESSPYLDWSLYVFAAHYGDIAYLPETVAVYRVHEGGVYSGASAEQQALGFIDFYDQVERQVDRRYRRLIRKGVRPWYRVLAYEYGVAGQLQRGRAYAAAKLRTNRTVVLRPELIEFAFRMYAPGLVRGLRTVWNTARVLFPRRSARTNRDG